MKRTIRIMTRESRTLFGAKRTALLLALVLLTALGLITLIVGGVAQLFGADVTSIFTLGKVFIAIPMWLGVISMFSFVCRM